MTSYMIQAVSDKFPRIWTKLRHINFLEIVPWPKSQVILVLCEYVWYNLDFCQQLMCSLEMNWSAKTMAL